MTSYQTRADWGAEERNWSKTYPLNWNNVTKFIVHINDSRPGARHQTPHGLQDYCMNTKGASDVDYNEMERDGVVYEGRGDYVGGHTAGNNSSSYGICVLYGGVFNDNDKQAVRERYEYACGRAGRQLIMMGHRDAPGNSGTDCPGDEIEAWVKAGMPWPDGSTSEGDDVLKDCRYNDKNDAVFRLQVVLRNMGHDVNPDGEYGDQTKAAVAAAFGVGDGGEFSAWQFGALIGVLFNRGGGSAVPGPPGAPGKTPTAVELDLSGVKVTLPVTAVQ